MTESLHELNTPVTEFWWHLCYCSTDFWSQGELEEYCEQGDYCFMDKPTIYLGLLLPSNRKLIGSFVIYCPWKKKIKRNAKIQCLSPLFLCSSTIAPKSPPEKTRYDTSLGLLTKKFVDLLAQSSDGVLDLNLAAETLQVISDPTEKWLTRNWEIERGSGWKNGHLKKP